jgi:hypothetical protein
MSAADATPNALPTPTMFDRASIAQLHRGVYRWEVQQAALPFEFRIRRRFGYPDPALGWKFGAPLKVQIAALTDKPGLDPLTQTPWGDSILAARRWLPLLDWGQVDYVENLLDFTHDNYRANDPDAKLFAPRPFTTGMSEVTRPGGAPRYGPRPSPVADLADKLLADAYAASGGQPVETGRLHSLADEAGISWGMVVLAGKRRHLEPRRVPGTRRSAWHPPD